METIDVGEVAVEKVIDFLLSEENLKKLTGGNSVPCFVLAHQITVPKFYELLIQNSETIDATTREFIDFIIFYGKKASIIEQKNNEYHNRREIHRIDGFSRSRGALEIFLDEGVSFNECLSQLIKYDTENINLRHLSNHMTRGAMALMNKYNIHESNIPSLLFINPNNTKEFFLANIDIHEPIAYLYEKILKPLSMCFREIEEYHQNNRDLKNLKNDMKESQEIIKEAPEQIKKLEEELSLLKENNILDDENLKVRIETLELRKREYNKIKTYLESNCPIILENENDLDPLLVSKFKEIDKLKEARYHLDSGEIFFHSAGHEILLREKNLKRLSKAQHIFRSIVYQGIKELDQNIENIKYQLGAGKYKLKQIEYKIEKEEEQLKKSKKFIRKLDESYLESLQNKVSKQLRKLSDAGVSIFIGDDSRSKFQTIRFVLTSTETSTETEKLTQRDLFICHASEDKSPYVNDLHQHLEQNAIKCWYDKTEIRWGDSIVQKVNEGLRISKYVLVVLSANSIKKNWPRTELEASLNIEFSTGITRVLPLLLGNDDEIKQILKHYPILSSKLFLKYSDGMDKIIYEVKARLS